MSDRYLIAVFASGGGTNLQALQAAAAKAAQLGFRPLILSSKVEGEAREVAKVYCGIGKDARRKALFGTRPLCLIGGGETTVTVKGSGRGGRNQEMALSFLALPVIPELKITDRGLVDVNRLEIVPLFK